MDGQMYQHHKYGYFKFNIWCQKKHVEGQYKALSACQKMKTCYKRNPKVCKQFAIQYESAMRCTLRRHKHTKHQTALETYETTRRAKSKLELKTHVLNV